MWRTALGAALFVVFTAFGAAAQQRETISFESRQKGRPIQITATIYWPAKQGVVPLSMTAPEFGAFIRSEIDKWAKVAQTAGVKIN